MIHPADTRSSNPRLQCKVCAKWKRLYDRDNEQLFFGGCAQNGGNDHLAAAGNDVCDECCRTKCAELV